MKKSQRKIKEAKEKKTALYNTKGEKVALSRVLFFYYFETENIITLCLIIPKEKNILLSGIKTWADIDILCTEILEIYFKFLIELTYIVCEKQFLF